MRPNQIAIALVVLVTAGGAGYVFLRDEYPSASERSISHATGAIHWSLVCDTSDSGTALTCTQPFVARATDRWLGSAVRRPGSTLSVTRVGHAREDAIEVLSAATPRSWGAGVSAARVRFVGDVRDRVRAIEWVESGSAVAEAIHVAAIRLRERAEGDRVLIVASDLRQIVRGKIDFERRPLPPARFVRWIERQGVRSDLSGITLRVCGVHSRRVPRGAHHTARTDAALRAAWTAAFGAMGAANVDLRTTCDDAVISEGVSR